MRRLHVLKSILVRTHADKILLTYLVFVVIAALIIQIVEPGINRFVDALWYCFVISTAGFGDIVVTTFSAKVTRCCDGLFDRGDRTSYRGDRQLL